MKYTLTRFSIESALEETGDDIIFIHLFYSRNDGPETVVPIIITFEKLLNFIKQENIEAYKYLKQVRSGIHGYGPKHSKILEVLNEEGFNFRHHVYCYFNFIERDILNNHCKYLENIVIQDNELLNNKIQELHQLIDDEFRENNIKMRSFTDEVDQALHEVTLKYFPELFEKNSKYIEAYREALTYTTLHFVEKIENIVNNEL